MATDRLELPTYRVPRSTGLDGGTKRLALVAVALGGSLTVVLGLWTISGHRHGSIPVIQAEPGPYRVKPTDPGGMQVNGADEDILGAGDGSGVNDKLAPPPETPEPAALRTDPSGTTAAPTPATPAPTPAPAALAPPAVIPAIATPAVTAPPVATPAPQAVPAPAPPHAALQPGRTEVQLAAVGSEDDAKKEWARITHRAPDLLADHKPLVTRFDRDGKTFWRLRTGGFADIAEATRFCEQARGKGLVCSIAAF